MIPSCDVTPVLFHDTVADAEAESGSLAHALGRVERVKDVLRILDSRSGIVEFRADLAMLAEDPNLYCATLFAFLNGIYRVVYDV